MELIIEYLPIKSLKPYERNTRKHTDYDVGEIAKSITECGFNDPIGIYGDNNLIVEGHGRLLAAKSLGMKEVPCIRLDHMTDEQRRKYAILHNKTAELSMFDFDNLAIELEDLDFSNFSFDFGIDADTEETEIVEDEAPEVDELDEQDRIFKERMTSGELSDDDEEYQAFLEKFEAKKTTDDCYTPDNIYNAVKNGALKNTDCKERSL